MKSAARAVLLFLSLAGNGAGQPPPLAEALERALAQGWQQLRIQAECRVESRMPSVLIFGNGVGIWNDQKQFTLPQEKLKGLLVALRDEGFAGMRPSYGGKYDPVTAEQQPPRLTCRVELSLDGATAQVVQLQGGRQSEALRRLAGRILDECSGPAAAGIGAESLEDGLAKIESGTLAPEALELLLSRRPEARPGLENARGWVLRVAGRTATLEGGPSASAQEPLAVPLDSGELAALARLLREGGVADLPINLYAEEYTDLVVEVLDRERRVQARRFAGMTPTTHAAQQVKFDRILEALAGRRERWFPRLADHLGGVPKEVVDRQQLGEGAAFGVVALSGEHGVPQP
ncbi:MAG TPA: hypothetical protein VI589_14875 [Vicinamibacteria bacterium]